MVTLETLEERIVLDAATTDASGQENQENNSQTTDQDSPDGAIQPAGLNGGGMTQETSDPVGKILNQDLSVVLISNALDQIERWSDAVLDEAQVIVYDYDTDDLASVVGQLTSLAETQGREIGHLAILSHGGPGAIYFSANELVTLETIAVDPSDWRQLDGILAEDARIDFYGCDVGRGRGWAGNWLRSFRS